MLYLNVPFKEKNEAKLLGAWWDPEIKRWYVRDQKDYPRFIKWILKHEDYTYIICDHYYIIVGIRKCFRCKKDTEVIAFGIEKYCTLINEDIYNNDFKYEWSNNEIHIASIIEPLSNEMLKYLSDKHGFCMRYSKTIKDSYMTTVCSNCKSLQGYNYLHGEVDSPFFVDSSMKAQSLKLYKVKLENDIIADADITWYSEDDLIRKYSKMQDFNINVKK